MWFCPESKSKRYQKINKQLLSRQLLWTGSKFRVNFGTHSTEFNFKGYNEVLIMEEPTCDIGKLWPLAYWIVSYKLFTSVVICFWISDPHLLRLIRWCLWRCIMQIMINMHCSHWRWGILIAESYTLMKITVNMTTLRNCIIYESTSVNKMIIFPTDLTALSTTEFTSTIWLFLPQIWLVCHWGI